MPAPGVLLSDRSWLGPDSGMGLNFGLDDSFEASLGGGFSGVLGAAVGAAVVCLISGSFWSSSEGRGWP